MLNIKIFEAFTQLPMLEFEGSNGLSQIFQFSESVVFDLRKCNQAFGLRGDYAMAHACYMAATSVLPHMSSENKQDTTFLRCCELLHAMGEHIPLATNLLASMRDQIAQNGKIVLPAAAKRLLATRTIQESTYLVNSVIPQEQAVFYDPAQVVYTG